MHARKSSLFLLLGCAALAQAPPEPASLEGFVSDSVSGAPLLRAHVSMRASRASAKNYGALTTSEGKFSIAGIAPGAYEVSVERVGFFAPADAGGKTTTDVALRAGEKREGLKLRLSPFGSISGRVLDGDGEPLEGAAVTAEAGPVTSSAGASADEKGRFLITGLRPGRYRVRAAVRNPLNAALPPAIRTDGSTEIRYAATYYPGATDFKSASRVEIGTGADVGGIEIRMVRMPQTRISGKVIGIPPGASASLSFTQIYGARRGSGGVKQDGTFELWNVDPGSYFLSAYWQDGGKMAQTAMVNLEVGEANIDHVELRAIPADDIAGRVVFEDEQARPADAKQSKLEIRTVDPGLLNAAPVASDVSDDGSFRLAGVRAARYRVMPVWQNAYVKALTLGGNRFDANYINLRGGSGGAALTVLVSSAFGSVSGNVTEGDRPAPFARVALVHDDFVSLGDVTFATADASGGYSIKNVRPGKYRIAAVDDGDEAPRSGNLDDYEDVLARLTVEPKAQLTQDLKRHPPVR